MLRDSVNRVSRFWYQKSLGLLLLRLAVGLIFIRHGWLKFTTPAMATFFVSLGLPHWVFIAIATLEVVGGLLLVLGILSRVVGLLLGIEMLTAILLTGIGRGFGAHEFELLLMAASLCIATAGAGKFSLFPMECPQCGGMLCKGECHI